MSEQQPQARPAGGPLATVLGLNAVAELEVIKADAPAEPNEEEVR
jgi:hypothetical protein